MDFAAFFDKYGALLAQGTVDTIVMVLASTIGAYVIGIVPALLLGGPLSDRFGRRPLLLPAPLIALAGSAVLAAAAGRGPVWGASH